MKHDIGLDEFKSIFFWEYFHRMIGRTIGLTYLLPAAYFLARGRIPQEIKGRVLALGGLIGFQVRALALFEAWTC